MGKFQPLLFVLAMVTAITAAFAARRVPTYIYVDPESDGIYNRRPGVSYHPEFCQYHSGTYCYYGTNFNLAVKLTQQQINTYVATSVMTPYEPDSRYEPE